MSDSVNKIIVRTLRQFDLPVSDSLYEGTKDEYFTYVLTEDSAEDMGDDLPMAYVTDVQIHYICPWTKSYSEMKRQIRAALVQAGFSPPEVSDYSDSKERIRHLIFECNIENEFDLESED